jgi:hypothetical protein
MTLSPCRELRYLELHGYPNNERLDLIRSITSEGVEEIVLNFGDSPIQLGPDSFRLWNSLDDALTQLAERSKNKDRLEAEFQGGRWQSRAKDFNSKTYLPKFVKKGRLTIRDDFYGLIYCSDKPGKRV